MRAPVYRHVEARSTIAGVGVNEFGVLMLVAFGALQFLSFSASMLAMGGAYAAVRLLGRGKPPLYWQHLLAWRLRRARHGGRLCAAARAAIPELPLGPYLIRDRGRSG